MDIEEEERKDSQDLQHKKKLKYLQICMGVIANLGSISPGMSLGFSAIALPQLTSPLNSFYLTADQASWFASLAAIIMPIGCLMSGPILDRFGRKNALLLVNVPCLLGWLLLATVGESGPAVIPQLFIGRLLTGLATGMTCIPATIYGAEIASHNSMRGMLVTWTSISVAAGILVVYTLGAIFQESWRVIAYICAVFPIASFIITIIFLPESPIWLISKRRPAEALHALKVLRGEASSADTSAFIRAEIDQITVNYENSMTSQKKQTFSNNLKYLLQREALKPFLIMNTYFFFQQASGVFVIIFYAVDVVNEAGASIDGYVATVLIGLMRFLVTIFVSCTSKRFGRRPPSIISGAGMTICMGILSLYLFLIHNASIGSEMAASLSWIPVLVLLLYIIASTLGFLTLPWAMLGEVFPARVRGLASGITTCMAYVFSFFVVKGYPKMLEVMGKHGVFFFYCVMALLGTVFVVVFLPETQGKSLQEIQDEYFTRRSKKDTKESVSNEIPLIVKSGNNDIMIVSLGSKTNLDK